MGDCGDDFLEDVEVEVVHSPVDTDSSDTNTIRDDIEKKQIKKKNYKHKYNSKWENNFTWIQPSKLGSNYFFCKCCNIDLQGGIASVQKHENTKKHIQKASSVKLQQPISQMRFFTNNQPQKKKTQELEIRLASFIVEHNIAITSVDHLGELIKEACKYPEAAKDISLKRTKCTAIIKNVLGYSSLSSLVDKMKSTKFSILVDESTDHSCVKNLVIVVRVVENLIVHDRFLALIPVLDATANGIYQAIVNFFNSHQVNYRSGLIGFGADGANTMMGENHSIQTLLRKDVPDLVVVKCTCHSLALCASYACLKLPRVSEDLVRDIYTYFQYSFKRKMDFKQFQQFVEVKPHKLLQNCQTRWLSLLSVVQRVVEQFEALKLYFQSEYLVDRIQASEIIFNRLCDPINLCYLEFMEFILPYIMNVNVEFQAESPKLYLLHSTITALVKTILEFYIKPEFLKNADLAVIDYKNPRLFLKLNAIYLGPKLAAKFVGDEFNDSEKSEFRKRCLEFYLELISQIMKRFPFKSDFAQALKYLDFLHPPNISNIISLGPLSVSKILRKFIGDINALDREWRLLRNSDILENLKEEDMLKFWQKVNKMEKGDGTKAYPNLMQLVQFIFTLPHSSACVERVFSQVNMNKTKTRNRLNSDTLSGILHSKTYIKNNGKHCFSFEISNSMINKCDNHIYDKK